MTTEQQILAALVKPLEWETGFGDELTARSPYGKYTISKPWLTGRGLFWLRGIVSSNHDTREAAQAAALEHHLSTQAAALDLGKVVALVEAARRVKAITERHPRRTDYHGDGCKCWRCAEDRMFAALADLGAAP